MHRTLRSSSWPTPGPEQTSCDRRCRDCFGSDLRRDCDCNFVKLGDRVEFRVRRGHLQRDPLENGFVLGLSHGIDRKLYFRELFRLQGELVKLQDWVAQHKQKIVVIFEGRDAAGKGGVIKRISQRLNPRICRVATLPAPKQRLSLPFDK